MERHLTGQEEALVEVGMGSPKAAYGPGGSPEDRRGCFKCAVAFAAVMGLVAVGLVAAIVLYFFMFSPSCKQVGDLVQLDDSFNKTGKLTKSDQPGRYDILTVNKTATYLIYVWVKLSTATSEEVSLKQTFHKADRGIEAKETHEGEIFFLNKIQMLSSSRLSIYFKSAYNDSSFLVLRLK